MYTKPSRLLALTRKQSLGRPHKPTAAYLCVVKDSPGLIFPMSSHLLAATNRHRLSPNASHASGRVAKMRTPNPPMWTA